MVPISALDALRREAIVRGIQASDRGHAALADFDGDAALSDEQLESKHTFLGMPITASDLIMTLCVMHSIHHLYEAPLPVSV